MNLKNAPVSEMTAWLAARLGKHVSVTLDSIDNLQGHLYAMEESLLEKAILKREREFRSGRTAARKCLMELGIKPGPILMGEKREPVWPEGCVGTISHCSNYCLVLVSQSGGMARYRRGSSSTSLSLGADIEQLGRVKPHLWPRIFTERESTFLGTLGQSEADSAATAMFSAKEAFFKLQHPLTGLWLDFHDAEVAPSEDNRFTIKVLKDLESPMPGQLYPGSYAEWQGCCIAIMEI